METEWTNGCGEAHQRGLLASPCMGSLPCLGYQWLVPLGDDHCTKTNLLKDPEPLQQLTHLARTSEGAHTAKHQRSQLIGSEIISLEKHLMEDSIQTSPVSQRGINDIIIRTCASSKKSTLRRTRSSLPAHVMACLKTAGLPRRPRSSSSGSFPPLTFPAHLCSKFQQRVTDRRERMFQPIRYLLVPRVCNETSGL